MATEGTTTIAQDGKSITISRVYDAPKALVFSMFKEPEHVAKWWGPSSWPVDVCDIDFRPGGVWHYNMVGPNGEKAWGKAVYQEIDEPNKIVFRDAFSDEAGNENNDLPTGISTVTFEEQDGKTTLTLHGEYKTVEEREKIVAMGMLEGMKETWGLLDDLLKTVQNK